MKKLFLFLFALGVSIGTAWAEKTVYLNPGVWNAAGAKYSVWVYGASDTSTNPDKFIQMTELTGTSFYQVSIPDAYTTLNFVRQDPSKDLNSWDSKWDQTGNITFVNNEIFKITGWGETDYDRSTNLGFIGTASASIANENAYLSNNWNTGDRWGFGEAGTDAEWFQIAWNEPQTFNTIKLLCENAMNTTYAPNLAFDIQTSDDGTTWTTRKHVWGKNANTNDYITIVLNENVTAKYVRFQGVKKGQYGYTFFEFEVYNTDYSGKTLNNITLSSYQNATSTNAGRTIALSVIGKTADDEEIPAGAITWSNSTPATGTVTDETFNALAAGTTTVSATAGGKTSDEITFTVTAPQVLGSVALPYRIWSATQGYGGITATVLDTEGNAFEGDVTLSWDGDAPVGAGISGKTLTFGATSGAGTYTLKATDGVTTVTTPVYMIGTNPAAPTAAADDVLAIYSGTYGTENYDGWATVWEWGYGSRDQVAINSDNCVRIHNVGTYGFPYPADADLTKYTTLHFDIYTVAATNGKVKIESTNIADKAFNTNAGAWTPVDIDLTGLATAGGNKWVDIYVGADNSDKDRDVLIDNVYFYKETTTPDPGYYIVGNMNEWTIKNNYKLTENPEVSGEYMYESLPLTTTSQFKVVYSTDGVAITTWYPNGTNNNYGENNEITQDGNYTIYFRPDGNGGSDWFHSVIYAAYEEPVIPEGLELTADGYTILVQGKHYLDRAVNNWELTITSEENLTGLGGSFWALSSGNADLRTNMTISEDKHTMTILATSTTKPSIYTPLYVMINEGQVQFCEATYFNANVEWVEVGELTMNVTVTGNVAAVTGPVTAADATTLQASAGSAAVIDLTGADISEDITITPTNKNAVIVVSGTARTPDTNGAHVTASNGNVVVYDGTYRRAAGLITLVDDNESQPAYDFVIDAQQDGVQYSRTVAAGAWVSYNSPASVTIPAGVTIYKATGATESSVTFTKQDNQALGANEAVILHNTGGAEVTITSNVAKIDLNLTANPAGGVAVNETTIEQHYTARAIDTDGSQYALKDGEIKKFNGAKIGAFRVYYTGLTAAVSARAIFVDGDDTTQIGTINANGEIEVGAIYNLQGQRVQNPSKGIYIVNGKKVAIK